jgi:hypothetical protein
MSGGESIKQEFFEKVAPKAISLDSPLVDFPLLSPFSTGVL